MDNFIITSIALAGFGGLIRLGALVLLDYPRNTQTSRGTDAFGVLIAIAWCGWGIHLLTR